MTGKSENFSSFPRKTLSYYKSKQSLNSLARPLYSLPKTNYMPPTTTNDNNDNNNVYNNQPMDLSFNKINQTRIINNAFGQLSSNFQDQKEKRKSTSRKDNYRKTNPARFSQPLPSLLDPGSNMSNNYVSSNTEFLTNLNLEPLSNAEELIMLNPMIRRYDTNYNRVRVMFSLSTFIVMILLFFEISAISLGIAYTNTCEMVDIFLIVSGSFHCFIVILEWTKAWVWIQTTNPVVPDANTDHMQVFVTFVLMFLYAISVIWYTVGFAWIPNVFVYFLHVDAKKPHLIIVIQNKTEYRQIVPVCDENFYIFAISYQVVVAILFLIRIIMCCMSDFCKGMFSKFAAHRVSESQVANENNPLHDLLPPMRDPLYRWGHKDEINLTGLNALYNIDKLCMITPLPLYPSDQLVLQELPELTM